MSEQAALVSDAAFWENVREARENGFALCCSDCGVGIYDDSDEHDAYCPHNPKWEENVARLAKWTAARASSRGGIARSR